MTNEDSERRLLRERTESLLLIYNTAAEKNRVDEIIPVIQRIAKQTINDLKQIRKSIDN